MAALAQTAVVLRTSARRVATRAAKVSNGSRVSMRSNLWLPGATVPSYLDGSAPGDYGFDPLGLGAVPSNLERFREGEIINGRFAMLGVAGCLAVELFGFGNWVDAASWAATGGQATWFGIPVPFDLAQLLLIEFALMGFVESRRGDEKDANKRLYPGGAFDPAGFSKDANGLKAMKAKEIANGRLAMIAFLGFTAQVHAWPHTGPLANLAAHVAAPWSVNLSANGLSLPYCLGYCNL